MVVVFNCTHPGASQEQSVHFTVRCLCWVAWRRPGNGGHHLYGRIVAVRHWSRRASSLEGAKSVSGATHVSPEPDDCHRTLGQSAGRPRAALPSQPRTTDASQQQQQQHQRRCPRRISHARTLTTSTLRGCSTHTGGSGNTSTRQSVSRYRFYPTCSAAFRIIKVTATCEINTRRVHGLRMKCFRPGKTRHPGFCTRGGI